MRMDKLDLKKQGLKYHLHVSSRENLCLERKRKVLFASFPYFSLFLDSCQY